MWFTYGDNAKTLSNKKKKKTPSQNGMKSQFPYSVIPFVLILCNENTRHSAHRGPRGIKRIWKYGTMYLLQLNFMCLNDYYSFNAMVRSYPISIFYMHLYMCMLYIRLICILSSSSYIRKMVTFLRSKKKKKKKELTIYSKLNWNSRKIPWWM